MKKLRFLHVDTPQAYGQQGYIALITVLIVCAVATAISFSLLLTGTDSQRAALTTQQARQARALAVACAQEASLQIHDNRGFRGTNTLSLGQGSCTYYVGLTTTTTTRSVAAFGTVGNVTRKMTATATLNATTVTLGNWKEVDLNGPSTPAFVRIASATPQSSPTSVAASFGATQTAGNLNVVIVGWDNTTTTITSVTDTGGNTYQLAAPISRGTGVSQAIYYARNITAANPTITVNFNAASAFPDLRIVEYSGLDTIAPLDTSASRIGTNNPGRSGLLTTNYNTTLLVAAGTVSNNFSAPGAGYTQRIITSPNGSIVEDQIVAAAGSYEATATASGNWVTQMVAFRAAGQ